MYVQIRPPSAAQPINADRHPLGPVSQVVVIAAGFDTRAYRLHAPGVQFYEIDLPHASTKKQQLVTKLKLLPQEVGDTSSTD